MFKETAKVLFPISICLLLLTGCVSVAAEIASSASPQSPADDELVFTTTGRVHPSMPEFTFHRIIGGGYENAEWDNERDVSIIIEDAQGNVIQEIWDLVQGAMSENHEGEWYDIVLADFNFDGYLDMAMVRRREPGTGMFVTRYAWLWDVASNQFVKNEQLSRIASVAALSIIEETQQIETWHRAGGGHHFQRRYEHYNGEFYLAESHEHAWWRHYIEVTYFDRQTGEERVELRPLDGDYDADNPPYEIIMRRVQVHEDMMPIIVRLDIWARGEWWNEHTIDVTVRWDDEEGTLIQEMPGLVAHDNPRLMPWLRFEDYNQDGYMDMSLHRDSGGSMRNRPHFFWLWDAELEQFVTNEFLQDISNGSTVFVTEEGRVRSFARGGWFFYGFREYEYHEAKGFVLVYSIFTEYWHEDDEREILIREVTEKDHITGIETITREQVK